MLSSLALLFVLMDGGSKYSWSSYQIIIEEIDQAAWTAAWVLIRSLSNI